MAVAAFTDDYSTCDPDGTHKGTLTLTSGLDSMDAIRVAKVEAVACVRSGVVVTGTVHLTTHHLIFAFNNDVEKEMWVPYPLIALVTRLPQTLQGRSPLTFHTRTFETFSLAFPKESDAIDVFESVKQLTVTTSVTQLYAFFYTPSPPLPTNTGWSIYSPRDEFGRMGVGSRTKAWRFTDINKDYSFCATYPARLVVPTRISDATIQYASRYRSKARIPALSYLHWANFGSITRSSQPMVGITQNRSIQDEKLIEAIFQTHWAPESRASNTPVYGATCTNLIIDARPTANAMANTAKGAGTENMDHYKDSKKLYLGIDHIHAMRESLGKVVDALREADTLLASIQNDLPGQVANIAVLDRQALRRSNWLRHISAILEGVVIIAKNVHVNSSHVLIHCSDGWDRTSQLSSLSQLCLDPFYRTIKGFQTLVEKDWLSFGHRFLDRCGHLSSDKFFLSPVENSGTGTGADAAQAFLASVQSRFTSHHHIKETSPIFHQFLETVRQIQRQYPERFEFNERFLRQICYHLYSCQFGTFLYNAERDRRVGDGGPPPCDRTFSVWDFLDSPCEMEQNRNAEYDRTLDDPANRGPTADMGVLFPNPKTVRFWNELYGHTDDEMNGRVVAAQIRDTEALSSFEASEDDPVINSENDLSSIALSNSSPKLGANLLSRPGTRARSNSQETSSQLPDMSSISGGVGVPYASSVGSSLPSRNNLYSSTSASPMWSRAKSTDIGNIKSVWGKLSSNASAAFSVVHDAYAGVAKDLRNTGANDDVSPDHIAELRERESLSIWGEDGDPLNASNSLAALTLNNPWATTSSKMQPLKTSVFDDNPQGSLSPTPTVITERPTSLATVTYIAESGPLPADPNVAYPVRSFKPHDSTTALQPFSVQSTLRVQQRNTPPDSTATPAADTDPLGVGLL